MQFSGDDAQLTNSTAMWGRAQFKYRGN